MTTPVHPKVKASTLAAAVAGLAVWLLGRYVLHGHVDPVIQAEIYAATPAVLAFAAGWLTPSPPLAAGRREYLPSLPPHVPPSSAGIADLPGSPPAAPPSGTASAP